MLSATMTHVSHGGHPGSCGRGHGRVKAELARGSSHSPGPQLGSFCVPRFFTDGCFKRTSDLWSVSEQLYRFS